jgi:nitrogen fixation/metabolism regulation signal transduction histidine kinase
MKTSIRILRFFARPSVFLCIAGILVIFLSFQIANSFQSSTSGRAHYLIIIATIIGITVLLILFLINLAILIRQYRQGVIGSKLSLRLIGMIMLLNLLPLFMVYFFAVQFLNRGIDSWFDVQVEQAIDDAVLLGQTSLEVVKQDMAREMSQHSKVIANVFSSSDVSRILNDIADKSGYSRITLLSGNGRIISSSFSTDNNLLSDAPNAVALSQVRLGQTYSAIESVSDFSQQLKVVTPVYSNNIGIPPRALQASKPLPLRYAKLAQTVESAKTQYDQMQFAREPLRLSLILTLTLISLASLLLSNLATFYMSRRIAKPLSVLARGTREVAAGNLDTQLPVPSNDEIGILIGSFNDMTQQLSHARIQTHASQKETEEQRQYLETVLSNLSSGVISIDEKLRLKSCNTQADKILNISLSDNIGSKVRSLGQLYENLTPFFEAIHIACNKRMHSWQDERTIMGAKGKKFLIIHGTQIPHHQKSTVIVFDDVTSLIQAQKEAAWGEVARRLAHEIKNPLTPIQLSTERIKKKFSEQINPEDKHILEKTTRTIVQQVEALKNMVSDFSDYAQAINTKKSPVDINLLLSDIADLHKGTIEKCKFTLDLNNELPTIKSDANALRQIFNNLMLNAIQAMTDEKKPQLTIISSQHDNMDDGFILVQILDTGPGIKPELRETLFEPYVSSKKKGSGLGLAIVKRLTEGLGGVVWAEENNPQGTRFIVQIPITDQESLHS